MLLILNTKSTVITANHTIQHIIIVRESSRSRLALKCASHGGFAIILIMDAISILVQLTVDDLLNNKQH